MGLAGAASNAAIGAAAERAALMAQKAALKKGKSPEQQKVIDFFYDDSTGGCLSKKSSKMTVAEYKNMLQSKMQSMNLYQRGLARLGLDESQVREVSPFMLHSFIFASEGKDDIVRYKYNENEVISSQYSITWVFFSTMQMFTYTMIFDMMSDNTWETTHEYFYTDICSITTEADTKERIKSEMAGCLKKKENITRYHTVENYFTIRVANDAHKMYFTNSQQIQNSINGAKQLIRDKKYSM